MEERNETSKCDHSNASRRAAILSGNTRVLILGKANFAFSTWTLTAKAKLKKKGY